MAADTRAMIADLLKQELSVLKQRSVLYIPSGIIEPAIEAVGLAEAEIITIVNLQTCNKAGKTGGGASIVSNIIWDADLEYFDYPAYRKWPFLDVSGKVVKEGRIVGTKENVSEGGPIEAEIKKWWPSGRYEFSKNGHSNLFAKHITTDTGWSLDVLSHEQDREQHEGPVKSLIWTDEPPKPSCIGAIMTRFSFGGIWLMTNTPIECGVFLDMLDDMRDAGTKVIPVYGSIKENCSETGKPNKKGTRRGLQSPKQIESYIAGCPEEERAARLEGKADHKAGKVYKQFDRTIHIAEFDLFGDAFKKWNHYMTYDPHRSFYPAMMWYGLTPSDEVVIWNEWPTVQGMGGKYYDEIRNKERCDLTIEQLSSVIRIYDLESSGVTILKRAIDPRFAQGTKGNWDGSTVGIVEAFGKHDIKFELPPFERIDVQTQNIQSLLRKEPGFGGSPRIFIMPHCQNTIRMFDRHYYEVSTEIEAETYKDFNDILRYGLAISGTTWRQIERVGKTVKLSPSHDIFIPQKKQAWEEMAEL